MQEVYIRHASPIQPTKTVADKMALLIEQLILVSLGSFPGLKQRKAGLGTRLEHLKLTTKWLPILVHVCVYTVRVHVDTLSGLLLQSIVRKIGSL